MPTRSPRIENHIARVGLVGCVKGKRGAPALARDLYDVSPLFRGRRRYVERTCDRWFILSALHGLVEPDTLLAPYDVTLLDVTTDQREAWSADVLATLGQTLGTVEGVTFEIHAGSVYRDHGIVDGMRRRGAKVEVPTKGLGIGAQLAFYAEGGALPSGGDIYASSASGPAQIAGGSYAPLNDFLVGHEGLEVSLGFAEVERVLGRPLPTSARKYRAWWANERSGRHSHARSWLDAGWEVRAVDLNAAQVRFARVRGR